VVVNRGLPKVEFRILLKIVYFYVTNFPNYYAIINSGVSKAVYIKMRKLISNISKSIIIRNKTKIGGVDRIIQCDETAFKKGEFMLTLLLLLIQIQLNVVNGIFDKSTGECFCKFLPNRRKETNLNFFERNVMAGSKIKTDGYSSDVLAYREFGVEHIMVNHSHGFRNSEGHTTNTIEGFWSLLKHDIK
jgi:hypothetical protein